MRRMIIATVVAVAACIGTTHIPYAAAANGGASIATFEGRQIDLRKGWGNATACTSDGVFTTCFRTEAQLDQYLGESSVAARSALDGFGIESVCSTALKLYTGASFGGSVLSLSTRSTIINLSTFGFDNQTSSYQVGACNATFYDGANAGTPIYPGSTVAGASTTSMVSGWDNRVSSVIIS
jgi:hypothetical protein